MNFNEWAREDCGRYEPPYSETLQDDFRFPPNMGNNKTPALTTINCDTKWADSDNDWSDYEGKTFGEVSFPVGFNPFDVCLLLFNHEIIANILAYDKINWLTKFQKSAKHTAIYYNIYINESGMLNTFSKNWLTKIDSSIEEIKNRAFTDQEKEIAKGLEDARTSSQQLVFPLGFTLYVGLEGFAKPKKHLEDVLKDCGIDAEFVVREFVPPTTQFQINLAPVKTKQRDAWAEHAEKTKGKIKLPSDAFQCVRPYYPFLSAWMAGNPGNPTSRRKFFEQFTRFQTDDHGALSRRVLEFVKDRPDYEELKKELIGILRSTKIVPQKCMTFNGEELALWEFFDKYNSFQRADKRKYVSMETAQKWMGKDFQESLRVRDLWQYFVIGTSLGKTRGIAQYLSNYGYHQSFANKYNVNIYCYKTIQVGSEFLETCEKLGHPEEFLFESPHRELTQNQEVRLSLGLSIDSDKNMREYLNMLHGEYEYDSSQQRNRRVKPPVSGTYTMTHSLLTRIYSLIPPRSCIFIDENIEDALIEIHTISLRQLEHIRKFLGKNHLALGELDRLITAIRTEEDYTEIDTMRFSNIGSVLEYNIDKYLRETSDELLAKGFFYYKRISRKDDKYNKCVVGKDENGNKCLKYIFTTQLFEYCAENDIAIKLFSATPKLNLLHELWSDYYIEIIEVPEVLNKGLVVQFGSETGSKGKKKYDASGNFLYHENIPKLIKDTSSNLEYMGKNKEDFVVLSFKADIPAWRKAGYRVDEIENKRTQEKLDPHISNIAGSNEFIGQDMIVAGKEEKAPIYYKDLAFIIGVNDTARGWVDVKTNSIKSRVWGFKNERLQAIYEEDNEYTVSQAIGRARVRRENCLVVVENNIPTKDTDVFYTNINNEKPYVEVRAIA